MFAKGSLLGIKVLLMTSHAFGNGMSCENIFLSNTDDSQRFQREIAPLVNMANPRFIYLKKHMHVLPRVPIKSVTINDLSKYGAGYVGIYSFKVQSHRALYTINPKTGEIQLSKLSVDGLDLKDLSLQELVFDVAQVRHEKEEFIINGDNSDRTLRSIKSLNGIGLQKLEMDLKPNKSSTAGFLGPKDSLIQTLLEDNQSVRELNLTHQKIATPLIVIVKAARALNSNDVEFTYFSTRYKINVTQWQGRQESPFGDQISASADFKVTNLDTGDSLTFSEMLGPLIYRYGFYEGKGTPYRVSPEAIVKIFPFLKNK